MPEEKTYSCKTCKYLEKMVDSNGNEYSCKKKMFGSEKKENYEMLKKLHCGYYLLFEDYEQLDLFTYGL